MATLDSQELMNEALKLLSDYHMSEHYLKEALLKRFAEYPDIDKAVNALMLRLKELQVLNDKALAESIAFRHIRKGNRFIRHKLKEKGIQEDTIDEVIAGLEDEYQRALEAAQKKITRAEPNNPETIKTLFRFLSSRGFPFDVITQVSKVFAR